MNTKHTIMLAEDDEGIVDAVTMILEMSGYHVVSSPNGLEIQNQSDSLPHLILLDICLSGNDGRVLCKQLKSDPHTRNIPVIMVSASREVESSAKESGANGFLAKPFDMDELLSMVEKHLDATER